MFCLSQFPAYEKINLLELLETDNKILSKVLSVFAVLCSEVDLLTREARVSFYDPILFYGEGGECRNKKISVTLENLN